MWPASVCLALCHTAAAPIRLQSGGVGLVVMGEGDRSRPLLIHRISKDNAYQRQGGARLLACRLYACSVSDMLLP